MFSKKHLNITVVALLLALTGLIAIQVYWIKNSIKTEEEQFNQHVNQALSSVVVKLDKERYSEDVLNYMVESVAENVDSAVTMSKDYIERRIDIIDSIVTKEGGDSILIRIVEGKSKNALKGYTAEARLIQESILSDSIPIHERIDNHFHHDGPSFKDIPHEALMRRIHMVSDVLLRFLDPHSYKPPEKRLNISQIDSILGQELEELGITADYQFSITHKGGGVIEFVNQSCGNYKNDLDKAEFSKSLFPGDYSMMQNKRNLTLNVTVLDKTHFLLKRIWWVLALSLCFIVIIIYSFYYTVSTINKQKKLSLIKNDFINNMTHELKTPISTIALACEALNDPDVSEQGAAFNSNYIKMISEENVRLGTLVERVLQSSVIEKGHLKTKLEPLNFHDIINDVASKLKIQVDKLSGKIQLNLNAENFQINGDRVHITNLFYNLIDNAIKYRKEAPVIVISTKSQNGNFVCEVSDNGIGISKEYQKKIFDKLFRVPTGNVHDVKGFGLGLSYVKAIIDHHNANISVKSQSGKGSTFILTFPIN